MRVEGRGNSVTPSFDLAKHRRLVNLEMGHRAGSLILVGDLLEATITSDCLSACDHDFCMYYQAKRNPNHKRNGEKK